jgi:signal transduction histidine kinase
MNPFFTTREPGQGYGLGLTLAQSIVMGHQGSLYLHQNINPTIFSIELPLIIRDIQA